MGNLRHTIELVFTTDSPDDADALMARFGALGADGGDLQLSDLDCSDALGATHNQKVVSVMAMVTLNVGLNLLSNVVYDALKESPKTTCVASETTPLTVQDGVDRIAFRAQLGVAAKAVGTRKPAPGPR